MGGAMLASFAETGAVVPPACGGANALLIDRPSSGQPADAPPLELLEVGRPALRRMIGRKAMVLASLAAVRSYFRGAHRSDEDRQQPPLATATGEPFRGLADQQSDGQALAWAATHFGAAWLLALSGRHWLSLGVGVLLLLWRLWAERRERTRLELLADSRLQLSTYARTARTIPEYPRWLNAVLVKSWREAGLEKVLSAAICEQIIEQFVQLEKGSDQIQQLQLEAFGLGSKPPRLRSVCFENGDVFGEIRLNFELVSPPPRPARPTPPIPMSLG
jgi:hypothetical protein